MKLIRIIFLYISLLMISNASAQSLDTIISDSENLYRYYVPFLELPTYSVQNTNLYNNLPNNKNINVFQIELTKLESKQFRKDVGLVFKANANYNFRNAFNEDTGGLIRGRIRAEIEWNILKEGFIHNKTKSELKENELEVLKLESNRVTKELWRRQFRVDYNYVLNKEITNLYLQYLSFENEYFDIINKLYFKKLLKKEKLIEVGNQIIVIKNQLELVKKENRIIKDSVSFNFLQLNKLPILKIKQDSIVLLNESNSLFYKERNIKLNSQASNKYNLSVYVNHNFNFSSGRSDFFPSIGIRFRAPIRFNHRKELVQTKIKILRAQEGDVRIGKYNAMLTQFQEYNEKLRDLKNQFKNWKVLNERTRIVKILKLEIDNKESGLLLLNLMEQKFKILENMIQIKRKLYGNISKIFELNASTSFSDFVCQFNFNDEINKQATTLIKSEKYSLNFQLKFLKAKRIHKICVLKNDISVQSFLRAKKINFVVTERIKAIPTEQIINSDLNLIK